MSNKRNSKFGYYAPAVIEWLLPVYNRNGIASRLERQLGKLSQEEWAEVADRVNYYCKLSPSVDVGKEAQPLKEFKMGKKHRTYFFDSYHIVRHFPTHLRWNYAFGDNSHIAPYPCIQKSRLLGNNQNAVLLNLNKVRHFLFINDPFSLAQKQDRAVFRGACYQENRKRFMQACFSNPLIDAADVFGNVTGNPPEWQGEKLTIDEHLRYKFIFALEGNDVATNLKWIMSSNSVAVMPRPTCETWFMEGRLVAEKHYIEVAPDFSDVEEKLQYYASHPTELQTILTHQHAYINRFRNKKRETLIGLLVMMKYFWATAQVDIKTPLLLNLFQQSDK